MEYGVAHLGIIPARAEASDQAEIVTHVLFGEHFKIIEEYRSASGALWLKIILHHDNYECWICGKQYTEITIAEYDELSLNDFPVSETLLGHLSNPSTGERMPIPVGSILPFYHQGRVKIRHQTWTFEGKTASKQKIDRIQYANQFIGTPYLWGGRGPLGIDCSGFIQLVHRLCGINLPRDAYQQAEMGSTLSFIELSEPGDLVFFDNAEGRINHVGMIIEPGKVIHASGKVRIDKIDHQGIYAEDYKKYTHQLRIIKRLD